jgi:diaminopropionate ammonia-lyase
MNNTPPSDPSFDPRHLWPDYRPTALVELRELARRANVSRVFVKVEGTRPLGNFKALGGMVAGLRALSRAAGVESFHGLDATRIDASELPRLICASDGNHGLAVAAAAHRAGAAASIFLPIGVSGIRARRVEAFGAGIVWVAGTYDDAVRDAAAAAAGGAGLLIPDTSTDPDDAVVKDVMTGYGLLTRELVAQFDDEIGDRPGHLFIQAGVGGLAAAMAEGLCDIMSHPRRLLIVEPESAACVARALAERRPVRILGNLHTSAQMLSCGLASASALAVLLRHEARAVLVNEDDLQNARTVMRDLGGPDTTVSGAAGLAGLLRVAADPSLRAAHGLGIDSKVLLVATEGPVTDEMGSGSLMA